MSKDRVGGMVGGLNIKDVRLNQFTESITLCSSKDIIDCESDHSETREGIAGDLEMLKGCSAVFEKFDSASQVLQFLHQKTQFLSCWSCAPSVRVPCNVHL
jgi:hypothetical protein